MADWIPAPTGKGLRIEIRERDLEGGGREIQVRGELDLSVASKLQDALDRSIERDRLVISLCECEFIDSTGLAVIVRDHLRREQDGKRLAVTGCSVQVRRILDVTGLSENGLVFESTEEALAAWKAAGEEPVHG